jgi:hypothetical protein
MIQQPDHADLPITDASTRPIHPNQTHNHAPTLIQAQIRTTTTNSRPPGTRGMAHLDVADVGPTIRALPTNCAI